MKLTPSEKKDLVEAIKEYEAMDSKQQELAQLEHEIGILTKADLGPLKRGCPCCGR